MRESVRIGLLAGRLRVANPAVKQFLQIFTNMVTQKQRMRGNDLLRLLAEHSGHTAPDITAHFQITRSAIHGRLRRLMRAELVMRKCEGEGELGRPAYVYYLTSRGEAALATAAQEERA